MAEAIITRRDERFVGVEIDRPVIVPPFKGSTKFSGASKVSFSTWNYPLGGEDVKCTKAGYLYVCSTRERVNDDASASIAASSTTSYEIHIGDKVYKKTTSPIGSNAMQVLKDVFIVPECATVAVWFETNNNNYSRTLTIVCSAE